MKTMIESTIIENIGRLWPRNNRTPEEVWGFAKRLGRYPLEQVLAALEAARYANRWNNPVEAEILAKLGASRPREQAAPKSSRSVDRYRRIWSKHPGIGKMTDQELIEAWWAPTLEHERMLYGRPRVESLAQRESDLAEIDPFSPFHVSDDAIPPVAASGTMRRVMAEMIANGEVSGKAAEFLAGSAKRKESRDAEANRRRQEVRAAVEAAKT